MLATNREPAGTMTETGSVAPAGPGKRSCGKTHRVFLKQRSAESWTVHLQTDPVPQSCRS